MMNVSLLFVPYAVKTTFGPLIRNRLVYCWFLLIVPNEEETRGGRHLVEEQE